MNLDNEIDNQVIELRKKTEVMAVGMLDKQEPSEQYQYIELYVVVEGNGLKNQIERKENIIFKYHYISKKQIKQKLSDNYDWKVYNYLKTVEVLYDPDNVIESLRNEVKETVEKSLKLNKGDKEEIRNNIWSLKKDIETNDVAQKRFLMNKLFDFLVESTYRLHEEPLVREENRLNQLKEIDGYVYKLGQDYLISSSTMEKNQKLEKIIAHFSKRIGEPRPKIT